MSKRNAFQREIRHSLGDLIREAREARGLSQLQLASQLEEGLHPTTVSGWETGEQIPRADRMFDLIVILRLPLQATAVVYLQALRERALDLEAAGAASRRQAAQGRPRRP